MPFSAGPASQSQTRTTPTKEAPMASAKERGEAFLAENAKADGVQVTDSGLQYREIEPGSGEPPKLSDTVRCHYAGTLIDGAEFDSSYSRGQPAEFPVSGVIAGWTEALQMMKPGAKWEVFLPSDIAYGSRGAGGAIGPDETLIFTIELLAVV
ncbi:MAG: FKBP-type peptidyl-prolyl cis-trans isomerase [Planctomycetota bacterium]